MSNRTKGRQNSTKKSNQVQRANANPQRRRTGTGSQRIATGSPTRNARGWDKTSPSKKRKSK